MLAYVDSFSGLIPCRIITARSDLGAMGERNRFLVQYTRTSRFYTRNEFEWLPITRVVPRTAVRRRKYSTVICGYAWSTEFKRS